jgi:hypothetical protein
MHKPNSKWISFLSAGIFLLMIMMQPIHQIGHLLEHHDHEAIEIQDNLLSIVSSDTHCEICDFNFAHPVEIEFQNFDLSIVVEEIFSSILQQIQTKSSSIHLGTLFLRGPPQIA